MTALEANSQSNGRETLLLPRRMGTLRLLPFRVFVDAALARTCGAFIAALQKVSLKRSFKSNLMREAQAVHLQQKVPAIEAGTELPLTILEGMIVLLPRACNSTAFKC